MVSADKFADSFMGTVLDKLICFFFGSFQNSLFAFDFWQLDYNVTW